jgi:hypothetical protein
MANNIPERNSSHRRTWHVIGVALLMFGSLSGAAHADESGVSYWLPGRFGSLAATPQVPGWSMAAVYYHTSVEASGAVAAARQIQIGRFPATVNVNLNASLNAQADLILLNPTYTFGTPVRRPGTNSPPSRASPTTSRILTRNTRVESTSTSIGESRNFFPSRFSSASSVMDTSRSPTTSVSIRCSADSGPASSGSARSSDFCSRSATCRDIST